MLTKEAAEFKAEELLRSAQGNRDIENSRSTQPMVWLFPTLAKIPPSARYGALREARNYASKHRFTLILSVAAILAFTASIVLHIDHALPEAASIASWCGIALFFCAAV